jgi:hypothetical protein
VIAVTGENTLLAEQLSRHRFVHRKLHINCKFFEVKN